VIAAVEDSLIPIEATRIAAHKIKQVQYVECPYHGPWFNENIKTQLAFLKTQLA
jgi:hypothetical protein